MTRQQLGQRVVVALLATLITLSSASDYDHLLKEADALIELPCHLVSAFDPSADASCYRLNWPRDPLGYINAFTAIDFDRTWAMSDRGEYIRPFTLDGIVYEVVLSTVSEAEHYLAIQRTGSPTSTATSGTSSPLSGNSTEGPPVVDAEYLASQVVVLLGGTAAECTGMWADPSYEQMASCTSLPMSSQEARQALDSLPTNEVWEWGFSTWEYFEELRFHSNILSVIDRRPYQAFSVVVEPTQNGTTYVVIQEIQLDEELPSDQD